MERQFDNFKPHQYLLALIFLENAAEILKYNRHRKKHK